MISVEHLMEIEERLHDGESLDDVINDVYQQGASDTEKAKQIIIDKLLVEIEQIRADAIKEVMGILHENIMIDCDLCPFAEKCNDDCWYVILRELVEKK